MNVTEATERNLADIRSRAPELAESAHAALALALAEQVDDPKNSATSKSMCAKALLDTLDRLRELTPPAKENDRLDDIARKRAERLAGRSASTGQAGS